MLAYNRSQHPEVTDPENQCCVITVSRPKKLIEVCALVRSGAPPICPTLSAGVILEVWHESSICCRQRLLRCSSIALSAVPEVFLKATSIIKPVRGLPLLRAVRAAASYGDRPHQTRET
jgi:hypothetical protein